MEPDHGAWSLIIYASGA